ncbi:MAG TPA: PfkB family carbohydrate kinase [Candidatus Limnocylindrales bacterium]|jgi:sugar/nucleoside kinase (ribokinase family)
MARPRVLVLGDLVLDVVIAPARPLEEGTDVPGRVRIRPGGSAANVARGLALLGARTSLVCAVGRDGAGRALVNAAKAEGVTVRAVRVRGARTGRIGVLVDASGERSFVADRGAADRLAPGDLRPDWFERADHLHLPAYSLIGEPIGAAGRRAIEMARAAGATLSVDLASAGPLLAEGREAAIRLVREARPDFLFGTAREAEALLDRRDVESLLDLAPIAVVKRGPEGATILAVEDDSRLRFEVATERLPAPDTTGAGDAFDAGFIVGWLAARESGGSLGVALHRAAMAGHRAAARHLRSPRPDLPPG